MRVPKMRLVVALVLMSALAACGVRTDLKPKAGQALPVAAYGRDTPATTVQLLDPPPQALPERSVELRKRSEERTDDPFDLPPKE